MSILIDLEELKQLLAAIGNFVIYVTIVVVIPILLFRIGYYIKQQTEFLKENADVDDMGTTP